MRTGCVEGYWQDKRSRSIAVVLSRSEDAWIGFIKEPKYEVLKTYRRVAPLNQDELESGIGKLLFQSGRT